MTTQDHPPHPTAETVIDSGDEAEAAQVSKAEARRRASKAAVTAGHETRRPSKAKEDKRKKERTKKWSFGASASASIGQQQQQQQEKRPQAGKTRTLSSSSLTGEKLGKKAGNQYI